MKKPLLLLTVLFLAATASAKDKELFTNEVVQADGLIATNLWALSIDDFVRQYHPLRFAWVAKDVTARSAYEGVRWHGLRIWETVVQFDQGSPKQLTLSLYNRGDAGTLEEPEFKRLVTSAVGIMTNLAGGAGRMLQEPASRVKAHQQMYWEWPPHRADLEWSFSRTRAEGNGPIVFRAEYVRLTMAPLRAAGGGAAATSPKAVTLSAFTLKSHVHKGEDGDVAIQDIPMVDQGQKGYCACATTERLMRYYGRDIDQHQIAQIADAGAEGTSPQGMMQALNKIAHKLNLDVKVLEEFEFQKFLVMVDDYNRQAVRHSAPKITYGQLVDIGKIYNDMDTSVLKQVRTKRAGQMAQFKSDIVQHINLGVPLLWTVVVGKVKEDPEIRGAQTTGGHMRMIIGYNLAANQVLYSDTWGAGHELKHMALDDAWTITTGLFTAKPRDVR